jgi:hypothetical protein
MWVAIHIEYQIRLFLPFFYWTFALFWKCVIFFVFQLIHYNVIVQKRTFFKNLNVNFSKITQRIFINFFNLKICTLFMLFSLYILLNTFWLWLVCQKYYAQIKNKIMIISYAVQKAQFRSNNILCSSKTKLIYNSLIM